MTSRPLKAKFVAGRVVLQEPADWEEGASLIVTPAPPCPSEPHLDGPVIIAGFGLSGRCVADLLDQAQVPYVVVERNPATVVTQRNLGRTIIEGDVTDAATLLAAHLHSASMLALTIPNEDAVLKAVSLARKLKPELFILARTQYSSKGMRALQLGADAVIKAEQAVALQFYEHLSKRLQMRSQQVKSQPE
ncbi:MAG: NAD-binding protein [Phycisphaerae bacterium]